MKQYLTRRTFQAGGRANKVYQNLLYLSNLDYCECLLGRGLVTSLVLSLKRIARKDSSNTQTIQELIVEIRLIYTAISIYRAERFKNLLVPKPPSSNMFLVVFLVDWSSSLFTIDRYV